MSNTFADLPELARHLRAQLETKKFLLLYAYNGTGKTRLATAFKNIGKTVDANGEVTARDTLYFNAFTEDLFQWDNDLANDSRRVLKINSDSRFFAGLAELEMDNRIRPLLNRYADFDFRIDTTAWTVSFSREETRDGVTTTVDDIRDVARNDFGEIEVDRVKVSTVISTHHHLFFNVLFYELKNGFGNRAMHHVLACPRATRRYTLVQQKGDTPAFHHVSALVELDKVARGDEIHTHHFNMLRAVLEKTALFLGFTHFAACIKTGADDADGVLHQRFVDLLSHGKYSLYEPETMGEDTKRYFRTIVRQFLERYPYNKALFPTEPIAIEDSTL